MNNLNKRVVGSYTDEKETKRVIHHLMDQGFSKDQLTIYTNEEKRHLYSEVENVQIAQPDADENTEAPHEDKNFWESIRDAFKVREDHEFDDPDNNDDNDLLDSYREDLKDGRYVVVVNDAENNGHTKEAPTDKDVDNTTKPPLDTLGTTAGFPDEGSVQGMGDGGQPPADSRSEDGTPPELEDTAATADESEATDDRIRQTRKEDLSE